MTATETPPPSLHAELDPRRWIAYGVVLTASFMILLDISIVNVAIPSIQRNLDTTYSAIQWVLAGYQLAYGVLLITGGRLGDIAGRRRMFLIGAGGFTLASAACGFAPSAALLIAARVVQGGFAAMMYPQVIALVQVLFPPRERAKAFGLAGAVIGIATISGPLAGGLLVKLGWFDAWRPIFLVNVPIGLFAVVAAARLLPESRAHGARRIDPAGVAIASVGMLLMLYPIVQGREQGWPTWMFLMMLASLPVFGLFWAHQRRTARRGGAPLIDPRLFSDRGFVVGVLVAALFFAGIPAFFLTFSLFLQIGLGFSPLAAGLTTVPFSVGSAAASGVSIRLAPRLGKRLLEIGVVVLTLGMVALLLTVRAEGNATTTWQVLPSLVVCGVGLGCVVAPLLNLILAAVNPHLAGSASGVLTTMQQLGGAVGVALVGVVFFGVLSNHAAAVAADHTPTLAARLAPAGVPAPAQRAVEDQFASCFVARPSASDPSVTPPGCPSAGSASSDRVTCPATGVAQAVCSEALLANGDDFAQAMWISAFFEIGAWLLTLALLTQMPNVSLRGAPGGHAAA